MKRLIGTVLLLSLLVGFSSMPALANSFSGMVIDATIYSFIVKNNDDVRIFQIRPETKGERDLHPQDSVRITYRNENGTLVADQITVTKRFKP